MASTVASKVAPGNIIEVGCLEAIMVAIQGARLPRPAVRDAQIALGRAAGLFIDEDAARLDLPRASSDYKKLFALYNGLNTLSQLAETAKAKPASAASADTAKAKAPTALAAALLTAWFIDRPPME